MALRLRRGTEAQRLTITPQAGELIYVTDTKKVWVGDGTTAGGVPVDSTLGALSINDLTDVDTITAAPQNGEALIWNAADGEWQPQPVVLFDSPETDPTVNGNLKVNIVGNDSSLLVDSENNVLRGELRGDVVGSVYADDSTILLDRVNNKVNSRLTGDILHPDDTKLFDTFNMDFLLRVKDNNQKLGIQGVDPSIETDIIMTSGYRNRFICIKNDDTVDLSTTTSSFGNFDFRRRDPINGEVTTGRISGGNDFIYFFNDENGLTPGAPPVLPYGNFMFYRNGDLGIGTNLPQAKLDVQGDAVVLGTMTAASFKGSVVADDSTVIVDAINSTITAGGFVQFGSYTDAEIASVTPANGMVYYNSTDNRFRGYQNGAWINLDDGTAA